jgi:hypothetical protein
VQSRYQSYNVSERQAFVCVLVSTFLSQHSAKTRTRLRTIECKIRVAIRIFVSDLSRIEIYV